MCKEFSVWKINMKLKKITEVELDEDDLIIEDEEELLINDGDLDD